MNAYTSSCRWCGIELSQQWSDRGWWRQWCSSKCRQAAYRRRKRRMRDTALALLPPRQMLVWKRPRLPHVVAPRLPWVRGLRWLAPAALAFLVGLAAAIALRVTTW